MKKDCKIKLAGSKLRIINKDTCISIDLDMFAVLKVEKKEKQICFLDGDKVFNTIDFSNGVDTDEAYVKVCKKLYRKNNKFRASVFGVKFLLVLFVAYLVATTIFFSMKQQESRERQKALNLKKQQIEAQAPKRQSDYTVKSEINKAKGQAISVDQIFSVE